uniref:Putative peptidase n=1 Tax=viral metagenome TaxID=1070528 RepID=A0A6M3M644_9ZZZZ
MPYPDEHACRITEPIKGAVFARKNGDREHAGKKYDVIYQRVGESMQQQAFRYPKESWSATEAAAHCSGHDGRFEAAKDTAIKMLKADDEKQVVYGIVFEPDFNDADDEYIEKDDIENAAHDYMINLRKTSAACHQKLSHKVEIDDRTDIVESYIAPVDFKVGEELVKEGTWVVAMKVHDKNLWLETKKSITGFSAGGTAEYI